MLILRKCRSSDASLRGVSQCRLRACLCLMLLIEGVCGANGWSQEVAGPQAANAQPDIQLNFPEQSELKLLVDYVSQRLGVKILYDEQVANKRLTIKAPEKVPASSLLDLLESALKIKGLALIDADVEGWKQIVTTQDLTRIARPGSPEDAEGIEAVTQAFRLQHVTPQRLDQIVKPFLTEPGANTITVEDQNLLIITDYARNLQRINELVKTIDRAGPPSVMEVYEVKHVEASSLAQQLSAMLAAQAQSEGPRSEAPRYNITSDDRTNQLVIVGPESTIDQIRRLIRTLDIPLGLRTEVYQPEFIAAERIDSLIQELFDPLTIKRLYRSAIDVEDNLLIVTAPDNIHERIGWLSEQMDVEARRPGSAVKFYKLKNATAEEVLSTLLSIQQGSGPGFFGAALTTGGVRGVSPLGRGPTGTAGYSFGDPFVEQFVPGQNFPGTPLQPEPTLPPAFVPQVPPQQAANGQAPVEDVAAAPGEVSFIPENARITADPFTNSIIVVGDRYAQEVYENLIDFLDKKRPQVMIEARVVIIDTSDDFTLGVELSGGDRTGMRRLFEFTSYGLSTVDPATGALSLIPGRGFNWTLVDPDNADAIIRALATHSRARVTSTPRVLVNDNATGTLASVAEVPFTSVNASNTVATTSFAGFAEAGTTIEVTPRISEDDHLLLDYVVTLNSFTGTGGDGVPPPRQTNEVRSTVTVPDGYTVVVGGLKSTNLAKDYEGIPFIEFIPIVRTLTGLQSSAASETTLFVFLRPVILRDDKFRDLQYLSNKSLRAADCRENFPASLPMVVR